jgi:GNAT superfamily N-acetyltransferase
MSRDAKIRILIRVATDEEVAWAQPGAAGDGVNLEQSDAARPTTWWIALSPRGHRLGISGMMPVEDGGQRLRGSWVAPAWRGLGVWWTMVQHRLEEARRLGAAWAETYAVHPGPLLRNGWRVLSAKHRHGAVHIGISLDGKPVPTGLGALAERWEEQARRSADAAREDGPRLLFGNSANRDEGRTEGVRSARIRCARELREALAPSHADPGSPVRTGGEG